MFEVRQVPAASIDEVNRMCLPRGVKEGPALNAVLRESAAAHARAEAMGARVFGAFMEGRPVGHIEVMPIEAAPLPLQGEDLWVIRCLWVLPPAEGKGIGKALMGQALDAARGSAGVAALTFPGWVRLLQLIRALRNPEAGATGPFTHGSPRAHERPGDADPLAGPTRRCSRRRCTGSVR